MGQGCAHDVVNLIIFCISGKILVLYLVFVYVKYGLFKLCDLFVKDPWYLCILTDSLGQ